MTTPIRLDPVDGWHHITCHRIENDNLFEDDDERWLMLRLFGDAAKKFSVHVVGYSLMGNHIHIVLYCPYGGVSHFMHHVNSIYARTYNQRHGRRGPLFTSNFYNKLITDDGQLMFTMRYVDRNALELGVDIRTYPWSSYSAYVRPNETKSVVPLYRQTPLGIAGGTAAYQAFVETDNVADKFRLFHGKTAVRATPQPDLPAVFRDLQAVCKAAAAANGRTARSQRLIERSAAALIAHEVAIGYGEENQRFFGFSSMSAYTSFLYRARRWADAEPALFDVIRTRWMQHRGAIAQAS